MCLKRIITLTILLFSYYLAAADGVYTDFDKALENRFKATTIRIIFKNLDSIPDILDQFPNLEVLEIENNVVRALPQSLFKCKKLKKLSLFKNHIACLPEAVGRLTKLEYLSISYNRLTKLPDSIGYLPVLKNLNVSGNQLQKLPVAIGNLKKLTDLHAAYNQLDTLTPVITDLSNLTLLDIGNNKIPTLPVKIGKLQNLKFLYIERNQLAEIPASISNCINLQEFDAVYCGVLRLPDALADIQRLDDVYMDDRTICFYQNPRFRFRQRIHVVSWGEYPYRPNNKADTFLYPLYINPELIYGNLMPEYLLTSIAEMLALYLIFISWMIRLAASA